MSDTSGVIQMRGRTFSGLAYAWGRKYRAKRYSNAFVYRRSLELLVQLQQRPGVELDDVLDDVEVY